MNDKLSKELKEIRELFANAYLKLNSIINQNEDVCESLLQDENISRIQTLLSNNEDIEEIKEIVNKAYDKIKEYLIQSVLPNNYYTINDVYIEYRYVLSSGLKAREINKSFYDDVRKRYYNNIIIEDYKRQVYNNS